MKKLVRYPKVKYPLTDKYLRQLFHWVNGVYFDGRLEEPLEIKFCDDKCKIAGGDGSDAHCGCKTRKDKYETLLHVHKDFKQHQSMTLLNVLHECCHIKQGWGNKASHGMHFQAEILRLITEGAYDGVL